MAEETVVTRGHQITLTKGVRKKLRIEEGDRIVLNVLGDVAMVSKRDPAVFDTLKPFLPKRFERVLKAVRSDAQERMKRLKVVE